MPIDNLGGYLNSIMDIELKTEREGMSKEEIERRAKGILYSRGNLETQIRAKYGNNLPENKLYAIVKNMFPDKFQK